MSFLPGIVQGNLNRAAVHIVVTSNTNLTLTASDMAKGQAHLTYDGDTITQIGTATGVVNATIQQATSASTMVAAYSGA